MKSYTALRNLYAKFTQNDTANNLADGDNYINDSIRTVYNLRGGKWWFLEGTKDVATIANQREYQVPNGFRKIMDLYVSVGSTIYLPEPVYDPDRWNLILAYRIGASDTPMFYFRRGNKVAFAPIPASTGSLITFRGRLQPSDLSIADYTTGSVVSITSGATALIGTGTTWTADMVGRYIRITQTTAANGGDGEWYQIGTYTSATSIGLLKPYEGTTITAGTAAYTIGQMSLIPEAYDTAPVYRAAAQYWEANGEVARAQQYWMLYDGGYEMGKTKIYGGLIGQMLENEGETMEGVYLAPFGSRANVVNTGAWWSPWQSNATGL